MEHDYTKFIGGSKISVIMGVNPWETERHLYEVFIGTIEPEDLTGNEAVEMGIELEDTVARLFTKRTGLAVRRAPKRYFHKDHPQFTAQVDRLVTGEDDLLECKTASLRKERDWDGDDVPIHYTLQVQWQLFITGRSCGYIAVLIGGQKFVWKKIDADPELHQKMKVAALAFLDRVARRDPPPVQASDNEMMVQLYPSAGKDIAEAAQDINSAVQLLQQTKAEIEVLKAQKDELEAKLKDVIGDGLGIKTPEYLVKWINIKGSTFQVTKPDSRQLRITKNKENQDGK